jgi:translation initiation factor IF-2
MPQTVEAINHAKAAKVPMIVAINKIDKPTPSPSACAPNCCSTRSRSNRSGGECSTSSVRPPRRPISTGCSRRSGLQAEISSLKANPQRPAEGTVIEAKLDRGRGPVATVLVQRGTLHVGDIIVAGAEWGRVRALVTTPAIRRRGRPSFRSRCWLHRHAGGRRPLAVVENEARARELTDYRVRQKREKARARDRHARLARADDAQLKTAAARNSR